VIGPAASAQLPNKLVSAGNGVDYAYRDAGAGGGVPLVLLMHFRGNLDNWDPALIDALAAKPAGPAADVRPDRGPQHGHDLGDPPGAV
jgi:pimeloyl-ACP methyl ester carboxylesterase